MNTNSWTMAQHAEYYYREVLGVDMPSDPVARQKMYEAWVELAFQDFKEMV